MSVLCISVHEYQSGVQWKSLFVCKTACSYMQHKGRIDPPEGGSIRPWQHPRPLVLSVYSLYVHCTPLAVAAAHTMAS